MHIIQDFLKIINNRLTRGVLTFFFSLFCVISGFMLGRASQLATVSPSMEVIAHMATGDASLSNSGAASGIGTVNPTPGSDVPVGGKLIFASRIGKYFYYRGCGGDNLSPKNLIYYTSETEAIADGKVLHSKCK